MKSLFQPFFAAIITALSLLGVHPTALAAPLKLVSSIQPLALIAQDIGGDAVSVTVLLPNTGDPHDLALRPSDRQRLNQAELIVWLGAGFEQFLAKPLASLPPQQQLSLEQLPHLHWPQAQTDLHLWLNPLNAAAIAQALSQRLSQALPDKAPYFASRLQAWQNTLNTTDAQLRQSFAPLQQQAFGVYHNGYGHWVAHYGLQQTLSLADQPGHRLSAKQVAQAQQALKGAKCLITDTNENNAKTLNQMFNLPVQVADPLAQAQDYASFSAYLMALGGVFVKCLGGG